MTTQNTTPLTPEQQLILSGYMFTGPSSGATSWNHSGTITHMYLSTIQTDGSTVDYGTYTSNIGYLNSKPLGTNSMPLNDPTKTNEENGIWRNISGHYETSDPAYNYLIGTKGYGKPLDTLVLNANTNSPTQICADTDVTNSLQLFVDSATRNILREIYVANMIFPDYWGQTFLDPTTVIPEYAILDTSRIMNTYNLKRMFGTGADYLQVANEYLYDNSRQAPTTYRANQIVRYANQNGGGTTLIFDKNIYVSYCIFKVLYNNGDIKNIYELSQNCGIRSIFFNQNISINGAIYIANDNTTSVNDDNTGLNNCVDVTILFNEKIHDAIVLMNKLLSRDHTVTREENPFIAAYPLTDGNHCIMIDTSQFDAMFDNTHIIDPTKPKVFIFDITTDKLKPTFDRETDMKIPLPVWV